MKLSLAVTPANAHTTINHRTTHHTLMAGGGLSVCSSASLQYCADPPFTFEDKAEALFSITPENRRRFMRLKVFSTLPASQKQHFVSVLDHHRDDHRMMNWARFSSLFNQQQHHMLATSSGDSTKPQPFVARLDDPIYFALKDSFEVPLLDSNGDRKLVRVSLEHNKNKALSKIYQVFVDRARDLAKLTHGHRKHDKPLIAVVTASVRDPFEQADFFLDVFRSSGANAVWLPLDQSFQVARDLERKYGMGCENLAQIQRQFNLYYREAIYPRLVQIQENYCRKPEQLQAILEQVDGIFFNEGDQSFTIDALFTPQQEISPELAIIQRRHAEGKLVVGGAAALAGGDVFGRPVPMLSNGHSRRAMQRGAFGTKPPSIRCLTANNCRPGILPDDLTYRAAGGLGVFQLGLLDTRFSEHDRETRLAVFTATARQRLAFGVDERTAMLIHRESGETHMEVVGENGVFILDFESGQATKRNKAIRRKPTAQSQLARSDRTFVEVAATSHYLSAGSEAIFSELHENFRFNLAGSLAQRKHQLPELKRGFWRDFTRKHCGTKEQIYWQQFDNHYQLMPDVETQYYVSARRVTGDQISNESVRQHCSYIHLPFVISYMSL